MLAKNLRKPKILVEKNPRGLTLTPRVFSNMRGFVYPNFLDIIRTGLVSEQFVDLDRRRALGSSGGQHERVKDKATAVGVCVCVRATPMI